MHKQKKVLLKMSFFLDVFAGKHARISVAVSERMGRALIPQELKGFLHFLPSDPSDEGKVNFLLRLAWTGVIKVATSGPPCDTYSALRERKGPGPQRAPPRLTKFASWLGEQSL